MSIPFLLVCNAAGLVLLVVLPAARVFVALFLHVVRLSFRSRPVKANRSYRRRLLRARKRFRPPAWQRSRPPQSSPSNTACGDCTTRYGGLQALHSARHSLWYFPNLLGMGRVENIKGDNGDGERHRTIAACPTWQTPLFPYAVKFRLPTLLHSNEASLTATCGPIASTTCCQPRDIIRYGLDEEDKLTVAPVSIVAYVSSLLPWTARHYSSVLDFCALAKTVAGPVATTRSGAVPQDGSGSSKKRQKGQKGRKGAKRQRQEGSDDEGQGDNGNGKSGADSGYDDDEACQGPLWACPFYKFDRRRYYRCVEKVKLNRYSDIKGHINRCHTLNNFFYCQNCWRLWKLDWVNRPSYEAHVQRGDCQAQLGPERLLDAESTSFFSSSAPAGDSTESKWYWIWDQLFPGHPHPESPYVETGIAEPTGILRRDGEASLQARLLGVLARHGIQLHPSQVQGLASDLMEAAIGTPPTPPRLYRLYPNNAADGPVVPNRADTQGLEAIYDEAGPIDTAFDFDGYSNFDVFSQSAAVAGFNFGADNMVMTVPMPPPPPPPPGTVTPAHLRNLGQPQAPEDPSAAGPAAQRQRQAGAAG